MELDGTLEQLVAEHGDRLLRLAYQLTHDRHAAEDVVQEAFVSIYRSWRRRTPDVEHVAAYARRAVVNEFLRRRRLRISDEVVTSSVPDIVGTGDIDGVVDRDLLWSALTALPDRQRAVLVLRYYEDLPDAQIAELIGAREATVRSIARRSLATLRMNPALIDGGA